ncbi:zinc ABC transporter substrate-binding protein [Corynebacterium sp. MSK039]|uniref:metal ABC transporter solute-binding protein, Zn/Mn family n=1 Tax=Corynebacterium sp. MSK039 TaxID=3050193 RepID=UPI00255148AD|nr:zinc ABC transporter substrate-binding protein [Corynebacterium sp. MSK039]MDK8790808.1 zinc ABC transporter substrate-binding protein [Corynebacterium sp. MSK039]
MNFSATTRKRGAAIFGVLTLTAGLAACSEGGSQDNPAENTEFKIVASTPVWGDIAKAVIESVDGAEKTFSVETIMENKDDDPHGYEATAADIAKAKSADLIAANGAGYDNWLTDNADDAPVVTALPLAAAHTHDHGDHDHGHEGHDHGHEGHDHEGHDHEGHDHEHDHGDHEGHDHEHAHDHEGHDHDHGHDHEGHDHGHDHGSGQNPHAWLDMDIVNAFADNLAAQLHELDEDFPAELDEDAEIKEKTASYTERMKKLPGKKVMLTESVAEAIVEDSSLEDITPESFAKAVAREAEPSAADLAAAKKLITDGKLDVLITNEQAQTPAAEELTKAAKDKDVATVNVNETPDRGTTYFDYVDDILKQLEDA